MHKLTLLITLAIFNLHAIASHIVGGEINYECLGGDEYEITLTVYRDCAPGNSGFDNNPVVAAYNGSNLMETVQFSLADADVSFVPIETGDPCLNPPEGLCVQRAVYTGTMTLPSIVGGYTLVYQRCCRNTTILNVPAQFDNLGSTFFAEVPGSELNADCNSNPVFNEFPPVIICVDEPFVFDHSATDIDADSLIYEFCNPLDGGTPGTQMNPPTAPPYNLVTWNAGYSFEYPIDSDPAFAIDNQTGLFTGTPTEPGQYVVGICVKEYRDGVLITRTNRDFQFNIVTCAPAVVSAIQEPAEPCNGTSIDFENSSVNGEIYAWDFGVDGSTTDVSSEFEPTYTYADTGAYEVTLIVNPGFECADTSKKWFYAYNPIDANMQISDEFCENGVRFMDFFAQGNYTSGVSYTWDFGENAIPQFTDLANPSPTAFPSAGINWVSLLVIDHFCPAEISLPFDILPSPLAAIDPQTIFCTGLEVDFSHSSAFTNNVEWLVNDPGNIQTSTSNTPSFSFNEIGTFEVILTAFGDDPTCFDTDTVDAVVLPEDPLVMEYIITEPSPCFGEEVVSIEFTGFGADEISWDMGDGTELEGNPIQHEYPVQGDYNITITAYNIICDVEKTVLDIVSFNTEIIDRELLFPNIISPNQDTKNDTFRCYFEDEDDAMLFPQGRTVYDYLDHYHLIIFDRWGVPIFDSLGNTPGWNGKINGEDVPEGTYYYTVEYQRSCLDNDIQRKGGYFQVTY